MANNVEKAHTNEEFTAVALALPDRETQDLWWPTTENPSSSITELKTPLGQGTLIKVADCTERMMENRGATYYSYATEGLALAIEYKPQCNLR